MKIYQYNNDIYSFKHFKHFRLLEKFVVTKL